MRSPANRNRVADGMSDAERPASSKARRPPSMPAALPLPVPKHSRD